MKIQTAPCFALDRESNYLNMNRQLAVIGLDSRFHSTVSRCVSRTETSDQSGRKTISGTGGQGGDAALGELPDAGFADKEAIVILETESRKTAYDLAKFDCETSDKEYAKLESLLSYAQSLMRFTGQVEKS